MNKFVDLMYFMHILEVVCLCCALEESRQLESLEERCTAVQEAKACLLAVVAPVPYYFIVTNIFEVIIVLALSVKIQSQFVLTAVVGHVSLVHKMWDVKSFPYYYSVTGEPAASDGLTHI